MIIVDGTNLIAGRLATFVAKQALLGEEVHVVNAKDVILTGDKKVVLQRQRQKMEMGYPYKGPFIQRREDRFLKRLIRGMLPYKQEKGRTALARVKCYITVPKELEGKETITVEQADIKKTQTLKYIRLSELCKLLGKKE